MPELVFVYNADSGLLHRAFDAAHKAVSPETYRCDLCKLTHGALREKERWRAFVVSLPWPVRFLHRDDAEREWPELDVAWPAVLFFRNDLPAPAILIDAEGFSELTDVEELIGVLALHFANQIGPVQGKPVLGLTGYPGSGKSAAAAHLATRGGGVIDADALARAAFDEPAVRDELRTAFGDQAFLPDGTPDRGAIARLVFDDPDALKRLEAIVHPRVAEGRDRLHLQYAENPDVRFIVEDCPLLIEAGLADQCDRILFLDTPRDVRLARLAASRGWTDAQLAAREANQADPQTRRAAADATLDNAGPPEDLARELDALLTQWGWLDA